MTRGTHPSFMLERLCTYIWPWEEPIQHSCQKDPALTSDHERNQSSIHVRKALHLHLTMRGTHPSFMSERLFTYIWPWEEHIHNSCQKGSALTYDHGRNQSYHHVKKAHGLITCPWKEPRSGEHQASPWSTQNSLWPFLAYNHIRVD